VIQKSGLEGDEGFVEPTPKPRAALRIFGDGKRYRYLSPSLRAEIDRPKVMRNRWKYIIVHNSGTRQGNARSYEYYHRNVRKMQNGLAYHFVIGNGNGAGDGAIELGNRWRRQINGGHVASDYLNNIAIGICLTGDFNRDAVTPAQREALTELIGYLRGRVGRIQGKRSIVKAHKEINPRPTDCPGDRFPYLWFHKTFD
jgi:N-acetyl-anhydromuramyl-L-alanine amidase AmpD